jgi:RNA polymerase sigma-70 factor, ECF subfamily
LRRRGIPDDIAADAENRIRAKLFLPDANGLAGLDRYVGSGRFESFIRVVAVRESISLLRSQQGGPRSAGSLQDASAFSDEGLIELIAPTTNPQAAAIKAELKQEFHRALATAFASLTPRQRTCLRMHLLDGVSLDGLAAMYSVHRATICRWLEQAREGLRNATRTTLRESLALDTVEFESILRTLQSGVDWSFDQMMHIPGS